MELLWITLVGGALALDATSVGQFMVSRPLVSGPLTGWILGEPATGLVIGALLELYLLVSFPTGGSRFPEGATATVVAVASAAALDAPGSIPLGIAFGLVWGQIGGGTIYLLRQINGRIVPESGVGRPERIVTMHLVALLLDFLRGALVTLTGAVVGQIGVRLLSEAWPLDAQDSVGLLMVGGAVSAGILLRSLGGFRRRKILFAAGLALGLMGARFL
jgi:mannose/fructose/N-acetylgalactosamine-specific phosphotransferase system component IIC